MSSSLSTALSLSLGIRDDSRVRLQPAKSLKNGGKKTQKLPKSQMIEATPQNISFAEFELDRSRRRLLRDKEPVVLNSKTFALLEFLLERSGEVVSKDEILEAVWPGQFVEEANLSVQISALRKALGERKNEPRFLVTVPGVGYKFVADVRTEADELIIERRTLERIHIDDRIDADGNRLKLIGGAKSQKWKYVAAVAVLALIALGVAGYRYSRPASASQIRSIAVLPFKPLTPDNRNESLEMGMADTLITKLSNLSEVTVRPITAVRRYAGVEQDAVAAGREQQVDAVLDGQIQRSQDKVRVTVRLVRVNDGTLVWTEQFDEKFSDIFDVQNSISQRVTNTLALKLTGEQQKQITKRYTENPEAYELYALGQFHYGKRTRDGLAKSIEYFGDAIAKDPNYALAHAGLASAYSTMGWQDYLPPHEAYSKAKEAIGKALALDDSMGHAHAVLGNIKRGYDWDLPGAEAAYRRAIELDPNNPSAYHWYGITVAFAGRHDESIPQLRRARELDPLSLIINKSLGDVHYFARRYDDAIEQYKRVIELDPNSPLGYRETGTCYYHKGDYEKAMESWAKAASVSGMKPEEIDHLRNAYKTGGMPAFFRMSAKMIEQAKTPYVSSYDIALRYSGAGDKDLALDWLERAYEEHSSGMVAIDADVLFDAIRNEPRFLELRRKVGLRTL